MQGLMMNYPLTLQHAFNRATRLFYRKEVVTQTEEGLHRYTYADWGKRTMQLANALKEAGVAQGDRVATFAWNTYRHLELYFAIPCYGAVLHTLNIRLFPEQLVYIVNDAEDRVIFVDGDLVPALEQIADRLPTVKLYVVMGQPPYQPQKLHPVVDYEDFIATQPTTYAWPELDENTAAAMCYTSGTTGNPKGVVYSHRSIFLHSMGVGLADGPGLCEQDRVLPVVPMFHANAWGFPHAGVMMGSSIVMPGRFLDPLRIAQLMEKERVTLAAGVPTIWIGLLNVLEKEQFDFSSLRAIISGGSAVPQSLIEGLARKNITIIHAWGMTETSPLASLTRLRSYQRDLPAEEQFRIRAKQGTVVPGVDFRVVNIESGEEVPWDGQTFGELQVRGPWVARAYYKDASSGEKFVDGWLRTGDVAVVDADGMIQLVDRTKDLVKSGGEWISSVELENLIMGHPKVLEACVVGVPHPKWSERPIACVVPKPEFAGQVSAEEILEFLRPKVAKWWLPDEVIFVEAIPKTSVGKFDKKVLRAQYESRLASQA
ncbi:long-chain fatty acid--CoA ligase [Thermogemmatispora tikiterensis]|uniref:Long-chain fatty acid--CoA ligase n=1 Tax=Thermogemmatispora tikiterensis TaxID=1825093 RepID=A0A328VH68_9CHLR|nr:long-chain fatty acid--CoA ligase [Thermogemmatispora tikiterensis]RAQ95090.1 long-chain fatty acid--CoA ligase [Thermogemmatispora tikiterensis]